MRKIGTSSLLNALMISGAIGAGFTLLTLFVLWPVGERQLPLSVLNYKKISLAKGEIILRDSPFLSGSRRLDEPVTPVMPNQELIEAEASGKLLVLGVIPPEIAIIKKGDAVQTIRVGEDNPHGTVDYVTRAGVSINGRFLSLK